MLTPSFSREPAAGTMNSVAASFPRVIMTASARATIAILTAGAIVFSTTIPAEAVQAAREAELLEVLDGALIASGGVQLTGKTPEIVQDRVVFDAAFATVSVADDVVELDPEDR